MSIDQTPYGRAWNVRYLRTVNDRLKTRRHIEDKLLLYAFFPDRNESRIHTLDILFGLIDPDDGLIKWFETKPCRKTCPNIADVTKRLMDARDYAGEWAPKTQSQNA